MWAVVKKSAENVAIEQIEAELQKYYLSFSGEGYEAVISSPLFTDGSGTLAKRDCHWLESFMALN